MKAHGTGNDFILLPDPDDALTLTPEFVRALCDRHRGLGGDGVIRIAPARDGVTADVFMDYRNADGSLSEMCGNGVRCVAKFVADRRWVSGDVVQVDTRGGVKTVTITQRSAGAVAGVRVDMGAPAIGVVDEPVDVDGNKVRVTTVSMGNPHAVTVVDDVTQTRLAQLGSALQRHELFPDGVNFEAIEATSGEVRGRIWERGVGETLASGTGAAAMAAAARALGLCGDSVTVSLPGGKLLVEHADATLYVTGDAVEVASGTLDEAWLAKS